MKRSRRGVGSNQYVDKAQLNPAEEAEQNARVRASKRLATVTPLGHPGRRNDQTSVLTAELTSAVRDYTRLLAAGNFTFEQVESAARSLGFQEDEIKTAHPNTYGSALVEAVHELNNFKVDRRARERASEAGTPEFALRRACQAIVNDAIGDGEQLDLEELAVNLDTLNSASEAREQGKATWRDGQRGEATLSSRFAAASVLSSRDPEDDSLRSELGRLRNSLTERGLLKINF